MSPSERGSLYIRPDNGHSGLTGSIAEKAGVSEMHDHMRRLIKPCAWIDLFHEMRSRRGATGNPTPGIKRVACYVVALSILSGGSSARVTTEDAFHEKLTFRPLSTGQISYQFRFTIDFAPLSSSDGEEIFDSKPGLASVRHTSVAPLSLLLPLECAGAKEVHLSIVAGRWRDEWGLPIGNEVGGTGGEVRAWFLPDREDLATGAEDADTVGHLAGDERLHTRWTAVTSALAGLFCSSLGQITKSITASPGYVFHPTTQSTSSNPSSSLFNEQMHLLHAHLPVESLCTENLTPFLKLLPSKGISGLSGLMRPYTLLSHGWQGMGVSVVYDDVDEQSGAGTDGSESLVGRGGRVEMWWEGVVDVIDWKRAAKRDFSLTSIFHRRLPRQCPIATSSVIALRGDAKPLAGIEVGLPDAEVFPLVVGDEILEKRWNYVAGMVGKDVTFQFIDENVFTPPREHAILPITFSRWLIGTNQIDGSIKTLIRNNGVSSQEVIYAEELPWYMVLWMSELTAVAKSSADSLAADREIVQRIDHTPAVERKRPTSLDIHLTIPPLSTVEVTIPFSKAFIRYTEHPPDASRGFDIPPAVLYLANLTRDSATQSHEASRERLYSSKLLLHLAEPDFSMPYNTIVMTCTLVALFFGSVFNMIVRRYGLVYVAPEGGSVKGQGQVL